MTYMLNGAQYIVARDRRESYGGTGRVQASVVIRL